LGQKNILSSYYKLDHS